jgi:hypothetical protein
MTRTGASSAIVLNMLSTAAGTAKGSCGAGGSTASAGAERARLHRRDALAQLEHRRQQGVQARERQVLLGLEAARAEHLHLPQRLLLGGVEQRRLADPGLPEDDERPASSLAGSREHPAHLSELVVASVQHATPTLRAWRGPAGAFPRLSWPPR